MCLHFLALFIWSVGFTYRANGQKTTFTGDSVFLNVSANGNNGRATDVDATAEGNQFSFVELLVDFNDAPTIISGSGGETAAAATPENTTLVMALAATDADAGQTLTYSIVPQSGGGAEDSDLFEIRNGNELHFRNAPDRESLPAAGNTPDYQVMVQATDGKGGFDIQTITIAVDDVDEFNVSAPVDGDGAANAVDENAVGAVGLTASAADADATTNAITYALVSDLAGVNPYTGPFAIDGSTGAVSVNTALNRETTGPTQTLFVKATSADGSSAVETFTVAINDLDEFDVLTPVDTDAAMDAVDENAAVETLVGVAAFASDADATTNAVVYAITGGTGAALFTIDPASGIVRTAAAIDRETLGASRTIIVQATSADGSTSSQTFTIAINDLDEFDVSAINDTDDAADAVAENAAAGAVVGIAASAFDADATGNLVTYSLTNDAGGRFAINASTGVVTVANGALLDFETASSHQITVLATSADNSSSSRTFTIGVSDVVEAITNGNAGGILNGTAGADIIDAAGGGDLVLAGAGNDRITGGSGLDVVDAGAGDDTIIATIGDGSDFYFGGSGNDTISFSGVSAALRIELSGTARSTQTGTDLLNSIENVIGGGGNDRIEGNSVANLMDGGGGNDRLQGGGGSDTLAGGLGNDVMIGGSGNDTFVFKLGFGNDRIEDFDATPAGGQDRLDVRDLGITSDSFGSRIVFKDLGADTLVTIDGDAAQTIRLVGIGNPATITQADFYLI